MSCAGSLPAFGSDDARNTSTGSLPSPTSLTSGRPRAHAPIPTSGLTLALPTRLTRPISDGPYDLNVTRAHQRSYSAPPLFSSQDMAEAAIVASEYDRDAVVEERPAIIGAQVDEALATLHFTRGTQVRSDEFPPATLPTDRARHDSCQRPSLADLAEQMRSDRDHARSCSTFQSDLYIAQVAAARTARLVHLAHVVECSLAECIRCEGKAGFVHLYDAFQEALADVSALSNLPLALKADHLTYPLSFVDALPSASQHELIEFLSKVKYDSTFLGDRFASMSHREVLDLLPDKIASRSSDSVFGSSQRPASRHSLHPEIAIDRQLDLLSSLSYASPLEALILSVRSPSLHSLMDDSVATDVWASVCARLIIEHRRDGAKLVPAIVDIWAASSPWNGKAELNLWILQTLQDGAFLLERPPNPTFIMHAQGRREHRPEDELRREAFYTRAVDSLLDLLADTSGPSIVPDGAIHMCAAIHARLGSSAALQGALPGFVGARWLAASFLPDAVTMPEMNGMAADHYISELSRSQILIQIVTRVQRVVLDAVYPWRRNGKAMSETAERAQRVLDRLCQTRHPTMDRLDGQLSEIPQSPAMPITQSVVGLSSTDIQCLVNALYPHRRDPSLSERDPSRSGLLSSASSVSGFSLFKSALTHESDANSTPFLPINPLDSTPEHSAESRVPDSADPSTPTEPLAKDDDQDEQTMRDVCAAIDDALTTTSRPRPSEWAMLVDDGGQLLCTVRDDISAGLPSSRSAARKDRPELSDYRPCKTVVKDLLSSHNSHQSNHKDRQNEFRVDGNQWKTIIDALESRMLDAEERRDFLKAHFWHQHLQTIRAFVAAGEPADGLETLLDDIAAEVRDSLRRSEALIQCCNRSLGSIRPVLDGNLAELDYIAGRIRLQRNKMWYAVDVRMSTGCDEARSIASVLRIMSKPEAPGSTRTGTSMRSSNGGKAFYRKTEAQILEILSASPNHGGPNKLSDDQTRALNSWLKSSNVDNICRGEERLHKLCMEILKCIDTVMDGSASRGVTPVWSWDDPLFAREAAQRSEPSGKASVGGSALPANLTARSGILQKRSNGSVGAMSSISQPLSSRSSDSRSSALTKQSSAPLWSPAMTDVQSLSSATSVLASMRSGISSAWKFTSRSRAVTSEPTGRQDFVELLRQHITSLLLSELGTMVFYDGSETDISFWRGLGGEITEAHLRAVLRNFRGPSGKMASPEGFNFDKAFRSLVREFSVSSSPYAKIANLHCINTLLERQSEAEGAKHGDSADDSEPGPPTMRTNDVKVERFRQLFCDASTRPPFIFRDLQFIAALVPAATIEGTIEGKSFWNAVLAAASLKQDARQVMVVQADSIIAYHTNNRGPGLTPSSAQQQRRDAAAFTPSSSIGPAGAAEDLSRYSMGDAATLLQIAAKEGDAVAQRELATMYMTHPELLAVRVAPLTLPSEVFKQEEEANWRKNQHPSHRDPAALCAAIHWMKLSSKGGDALATEALRQREEMDRLP